MYCNAPSSRFSECHGILTERFGQCYFVIGRSREDREAVRTAVALPRMPRCSEEAVMAAPRDQAARMLRPEPETPAAALARENSAAPAEQLRTHVAEEGKRRPAEPPVSPVVDKPTA